MRGKYLNSAVTLVIFMALSGCVGLGEAMSAGMATARNEYEEFIDIPTPSENFGVVVFYARKEFVNDSYIYRLGERIGVIGPGLYTFFEVEPGRHTFAAKLHRSTSLILDVKAGETYYVRFKVDPSYGGPVPSLDYVSSGVALRLIPSLSYVTLNEEDTVLRNSR